MKQHRSFEPIPSLWGTIGFILVFTLTVTAPRWMQPRQIETPPVSSLASEETAATVSPVRTDAIVPDELSYSSAGHSGAQPYQQFCASCHGMPGLDRVAGLTASDLFDGISDRPMTRESILATLEQGILEKGMLPMNAVLSVDQLENVVSFLLDLQPEAVLAQNT